jgi:hypothetical protein
LRDTRNILTRICDPLRAPGRQSWFFLQPYSLSDAYLTCSLMDAFGAANGPDPGDIHVILKRSHAPLGRLFQSDRLRVSVAEDQWMESLAAELRSVGLRSALIPDEGIVLHPHHLVEGRAESLLAPTQSSRRQLYQYLLRLPADATVTPPTIPEVCRREALDLARSLNMPAGRGVILIPHDAQAGRIPPTVWASLAARLIEQGYRVLTHVQDLTTGSRCDAIPGTAPLDIGLDLLLPLSERAGWVISGCNETLEVLAEARVNCRKTALSAGGQQRRSALGASHGTAPAVTLPARPAPDDVCMIQLDPADPEQAVEAVMAAPSPAASHQAEPVRQPGAQTTPATESTGGDEVNLIHSDALLSQHALHEIQNSLLPFQRDLVATAIAGEVNRKVPRFDRPTDPQALRALHEQGIVGLGQVLLAEQVREIVAYFRQTPCYSAHVASYSDGVPRSVDAAASRGAYGSYQIDQTLQAPHLLELALNEDLLNLCDHYLGCLPTLYSVHAWWTFAGCATPGLTHGYHRDQDDHRFLSLFTYLTDVGPNDGPIDLLCGSHHPQQVDARIAAYRHAHPEAPAAVANQYFPPLAGNGYVTGERRMPIAYEQLFAGQQTTAIGPAGSAFLADTFALHRGNPPSAHHRLACWIRFSLTKPQTYTLDNAFRVPASLLKDRVPRGPRMDWVTRLLIDHSR